ncbi:hypothetical protein TNCV_774231 [Trichonephila clavipes]|nr:hypothetical protein TNCV_774231 [Trichonephila clavipes]
MGDRSTTYKCYIRGEQIDDLNDGSRSRITNHNTIDSVCYASFGVRSYDSTPFAEEWNIRKASIASFTLTGNHRCLRRQWWNGIEFIDESHFWLPHNDGRIRVWRQRPERLLNCCIMHRHTGPAPGIMVWDGIRFHCFTHLVRIAGTLNGQCHTLEVLEPGVLPYIQRLPLAISQQDNARPHVALNVQEFFFTHLIELLPPNRKRVVHARTTTDFGIHHLLLHQINFGNMWKPHGLLYPKVSSKASLILCRGVCGSGYTSY